jgi:hypothetical protein
MLARLVARSKSRPDVSPGRALFVAAFIGFWMLVLSLGWSTCSSRSTKSRQPRSPTTAEFNRNESAARRASRSSGRQLARSVQTVSLFLDPDGLDHATLDRNAQQLAKSSD